MGGAKGFLEGGVASIVAGSSMHPFDVINVRMQLNRESSAAKALFQQGGVKLAASTPSPKLGPIAVGLGIIKKEGVAVMFSGIPITVLRHTLYTTTCLGFYDIMKTKWTDPETKVMTFAHKVEAGLMASAVGAVVVTPVDQAMLRMSTYKGRGHSYRNIITAVGLLAKHKGLAGLWRGSSKDMARAMLITTSQLATYDKIKETILEKSIIDDGIGTHVLASFAAGFVAAAASNPINVVRTRLMNMWFEASRKEPAYGGAVDCMIKTIRAEGPMALYKGFLTNVSRQVPFTVVLFVTLEQVRKVFKDL